ncbi:unnamed protein product [Brassicogethes aeneus]|uniref:DM13 domain-containing protein n=1 Tax=Brassicogethes aeneus TaxID=1431903 RepID=A0A9P0B548_BRAAE|nr:unnamed protein product [Brassicogethes aeneus]
MGRNGPVLALVIACVFVGQAYSEQYLGKLIGKLSELHHGVSGEVYAVDGRTLHIKDYTYDGQGPAAYFYASSGKTASSNGFRLRDENGSGDVIRKYRKEGVTLTLPEGKTLRDIKIFYVWCEEFTVNFGDVKIPRNFDFPRPQKVDALKGVHDISSDNIVIVDAQTLLIPNLSYDGEAPDAKFWVGHGPKPSPQGIRVPDENGKEIPLRKYDRKTIVLTLPGDLTVFDIGHFGIWCEAFTVDFGHIVIKSSNLNIPPSLKMLGVSPQKRHFNIEDFTSQSTATTPKRGVGVNHHGNLQPTTYRPPKKFELNQQQHDVVDRSAYTQNAVQQQLIPQQQFPPYQQQQFNHRLDQQQNFIQQQPHLLINQQQQSQQQLLANQQQYQPQQQYFVNQPQLRQPQFLVPQQQPRPLLSQQQQYQIQQLLHGPQQQLNYQPQQQHFNIQPQIQQRSQQVQPQPQQQLVAQQYQQLNNQQRQYEQQVAHQQQLQRRLFEEQQLKEQLARHNNRFNVQHNQQNQYQHNLYAQYG